MSHSNHRLAVAMAFATLPRRAGSRVCALAPSAHPRRWCVAAIVVQVLGLLAWRSHFNYGHGLAAATQDKTTNIDIGEAIPPQPVYTRGQQLPARKALRQLPPETFVATREVSTSQPENRYACLRDFWERGVSAPFKALEDVPTSRALAQKIQDEVTRGLPLLFPLLQQRAVSMHMVSPSLMELAANPLILERVQALIGPDIVLFEASVPQRGVGTVHRFHSDASFLNCKEGEAVAVWVALEGVTHETTLEVLPFSHLLNISAQAYLKDVQVAPTLLHTDMGVHDAAAAAAEAFINEQLGPRDGKPIAFERVATGDGDAVVFHGKTWHGSGNTAVKGSGNRVAAALRYMKSSCTMRFLKFDPPFASMNQLPPVVLLRGNMAPAQIETSNVYTYEPADSTTSSIAERSGGGTPTRVSAALRHRYMKVPLPEPLSGTKREEAGSVTRVFKHALRDATTGGLDTVPRATIGRRTPALALLKWHWTSQPQYRPLHAPHHHERNEVIIQLSGQTRVTHLILNGSMARESLMSVRGDVAMYESYVWHTITALPATGALYLCIDFLPAKWVGRTDADARVRAIAGELSEEGIVHQYPVPDGESRHAAHMFATPAVNVSSVMLLVGETDTGMPGVDASCDRVLVCLHGTLALAGSVELLTDTFLAFIPAGAPSHVSNVGTDTAEYLVLEFKGSAYDSSAAASAKPQLPTLAARDVKLPTDNEDWTAPFWERGFSTPFSVLIDPSTAGGLATRIEREMVQGAHLLYPQLRDKQSAMHMISPTLLELAANPLILDRVQALLGPDVVLFEAVMPRRGLPATRRFHSDPSFLTCEPGQGVVVWVPLREPTTREVLPCSHTLNITGQEFAAGVPGTMADAVTAASELITSAVTPKQRGEQRSALITFQRVNVAVGDAIVVHGRTWHGSENVEEATRSTSATPKRVAVELRYVSGACSGGYRYRAREPPFAPSYQLPPVVLLRGNLSNAQLEINNVYTYTPHPGDIVVRDPSVTPTQLDASLRHRYSPLAAPVPAPPNSDLQDAGTVPTVYTHALTMPKDRTSRSFGRGMPPTRSRRLAEIRTHWSTRQQYGFPEQPVRHELGDLIILFSGQMRKTSLLHNGTLARESLLMRSGDVAVYNSYDWHTSMPIAASGSLYMGINFLPASGARTTANATAAAAEAYSSFSPGATPVEHELMSADGVVHPFIFPSGNERTAVMYQGATCTILANVLNGGKQDRKIPVKHQFDTLLVCLHGTLALAGTDELLTDTFMAFIPAGVPSHVTNVGTGTAKYLVLEFKGSAYGD